MSKTPLSPEAQAVALLQDPRTIRTRAHTLLDHARANRLDHWIYHPEPWDDTVAFVARHIQSNYPDLQIPYHSRMRHFDVGDVDRTAQLAAQWREPPSDEQGQTWFDLILVSVLLDAGAGPDWSYTEPTTGQRYHRSEGLAVASLHMFLQGMFSADPAHPCRVDADALVRLTVDDIAQGMQVSEHNPMVGLEGRAALLRSLGETIQTHPARFHHTGRPGGLFLALRAQADHHTVPAPLILHHILTGLGDIWPGRYTLNGVNLGDVWKHTKAGGEGPSQEFIPFHKLSQWLTYSLLEPLELAGLTVTQLDQLTGLAEYRNGGLFTDAGVLTLRDPTQQDRVHTTDSELVVEWRALTVALLDQMGEALCRHLDLRPEAFPLAKALQGGTWSAGRALARQKRADGSPPLQLERDGTVF